MVHYLVGHSRGVRAHYVAPDALGLPEVVALVPAMAVTFEDSQEE